MQGFSALAALMHCPVNIKKTFVSLARCATPYFNYIQRGYHGLSNLRALDSIWTGTAEEFDSDAVTASVL